MARVAVVGAGVGGLSTAIRLRAQGHDVTVFERNRTGGKLSSVKIEGFTFDTGPSLLTLPDVFRELFEYAGSALEDRVSLVRIEHPFRHTFFDDTTLDVFNDATRTRSSFAAFDDGAGGWDAMSSHTARVWNTAERTFFSGPMESPLALLRRMRSLRDLRDVDAMQSLDTRANRFFKDPRLRAWMNRFATYSGSSPFAAPATLSCIAYVEQEFGAWHITGGLGRLATALVELATTIGVQIETGDVSQITVDSCRVTGVVVNDRHFACEVVACNNNAEAVYQSLLPARRRLVRAKRAGRSTSVFAMLLGLEGESERLTHHNLWYSHDQHKEFTDIFSGGGAPSDPTIYVCNPSVTDASFAPAGCESWFVLVNVASGASIDWSSYGDGIVKRLGVSDRVRVRRHLTPTDLEASFGDPGGSIYGTSSNSRRSAFLRAANRGPVRGLYLCGGSAHPGGGLPLVAMSGRIVAEMVARDFPQ